MVDDIAEREIAANADPNPKRNGWTRFVLSTWVLTNQPKRERNADTW